jgi:hypothetical protein
VLRASVLSWALAAAAGASGQAPQATNLRTRWLHPAGDTLRVDTLSIVPGSVTMEVDGEALAPDRYTVLPYQGLIVMPGAPDSMLVRYRVMPLLLGGVRSHKDPMRLTAPGDRIDPFKYEPPKQSGDLLGIKGLERSGSISRGVLFGNNQDLSVNSTLNLQLGGRLSDRIGVLASITDNNIPIQAGGNTRELQDFDQVFIKLFEEAEQGPGNRWELIAGDFVLQRPKSHFLTYLKKNKGLSYEMRNPMGKSGTLTTGASAAISTGKFARNVIQGLEGVQGPYRLRGEGTGGVIVVLSGSERVFIDGQPLLRGQENDYVIDYNTAEVTFTARRLITKDRRIVVEFQYSDKNYARSMARADNTWEHGSTTVRLLSYSEQDHRNQPLQQQLGDAEREALRLAGDDALAASVPGADSTGWSADQVLYYRTDSLGYTVYVYSTDAERAVYRVTFTQVGTGNGSYVLQEFTPNGRAFRWVAPDTVGGAIVQRGDFAPIRLLVAPRTQQLVAASVEHRFSKRSSAGAEAAVSRLDANTFSALDKVNDVGLAVMARGSHAIPISARDTSLHLVVGGEAEALSQHFRYVERYRAVEFERNWNVLGLDLAADQLLATAQVGVQAHRLGKAAYAFNTFQARDRYAGMKHDLLSDLHTGRADLSGTASWLRTDKGRYSDFIRNKSQLRYRLKRFTIGVRDEHELNTQHTDTSRALIAGSYAFFDWEAFVQATDSARNKWRLSAGQRTDRALRDGALSISTVASAYAFSLDLAADPRNRLATTFTYRSLRIVDSTLTAQKPQDTYLARIDYDLTLWKGAVVLDLFNEFGSGLEQRREYIYVQVPAGQGLYIWNDYNGNGIKELNEFELANFAYEANYLRVYVPSNSYVRTFSNQSSASVDLRPGVRWSDAKGLKGFVAKLSDLASLRMDRKTGGKDPWAALNPFAAEQADTNLTAFTSSARNTFFYDRTSRIWSVDHTWQSDRSRSLLVNGSEGRSRLSNSLRVRINPARHWTVDAEGERGRSANTSDLLLGRTWAIDLESVKPRITWQPSTTTRVQLSYRAATRTNKPEYGGQQARISDLGLEFRYSTAGKGSFTASANLVDIRYDGEVNTALGNELLAGLKPGSNATWSVALQRNLSSNLQLDLTYNGRRSEGVPAVHVGGAQVRAFF